VNTNSLVKYSRPEEKNIKQNLAEKVEKETSEEKEPEI
jgi:hypothetical protein